MKPNSYARHASRINKCGLYRPSHVEVTLHHEGILYTFFMFVFNNTIGRSKYVTSSDWWINE